MESILDQGSAARLLTSMMEAAQAEGALAAEALIETSITVTVGMARGKVAPSRRAEAARVLGAVYLDGGRRGVISASTLAPARLRAAVQAAVAAARRAPLQPEAGPADRYDIAVRGMGLDDPRHRMLDEASRAEVITTNLERPEGVVGVEITDIDYSDTVCSRAFASTRGVEAWCPETHYTLSLTAIDHRTGRRLSQSTAARHFAHVGSLPYGVELLRRLADLRDTVPLPPGDPAVVLDTRVMGHLLERLAPAFAAPLVESGASFLARLGDEALGHARVHLIDDAGLHGGVRSRAFDDRGVPPMPVPLIREGRAGGLYHDPESARRADARPTGHVTRGALSPANLMLRPGNRSRTQMLGEVPLALCFDHVEGELDIATGSFRLQGPAYVLERGQRAGVVDGAVLEGRVVDLLRRVVEVASDQERAGHVDCATTLIKGFPVRAG